MSPHPSTYGLLGAELKRTRLALGLTQKELGRSIGVAREAVAALEQVEAAKLVAALKRTFESTRTSREAVKSLLSIDQVLATEQAREATNRNGIPATEPVQTVAKRAVNEGKAEVQAAAEEAVETANKDPW